MRNPRPSHMNRRKTQGFGKVVVSGVWLGVVGAWGLWILGW